MMKLDAASLLALALAGGAATVPLADAEALPAAPAGAIGRAAPDAGLVPPAGRAASQVKVTPASGPRFDRAAVPGALSAEGTWRGTYRCNQGVTGVEIVLRPAANGKTAGTFSFFPVSANTGVPSGSFAVTADRQGSANRIVMTPGAWIKRPPNWVTVGADMTISNGGRNMGGSVKGPGCTSISLTRSAGATRASSLTAMAREAPEARLREVPPLRASVDGQGDIEGAWKFSFDPAHPEYSASASAVTIGRHRARISLFIDCSVSTIQLTAGYEADPAAPSYTRSAALDYSRRVMTNPATLLVIKDGREIDRFTWPTDEGGHATITPARMRLLLAASQLRLAGRSETIQFSTSNLREAVAGVMRQCKFRL